MRKASFFSGLAFGTVAYWVLSAGHWQTAIMLFFMGLALLLDGVGRGPNA